MTTTAPGAATQLTAPGQTPAAGVRPGEDSPVAGSQRGWREIAATLAAELERVATPCGKHPPAAPDDDCGWCGAEGALRVYRAACGLEDGVLP